MFSSSFSKKLGKIAFPTVMLGVVGIVLIKAVIYGQGLEERFAGMGNDDILRLTMVRDLIAGQSWFDQTQYRLVPPEGAPLHWSRYIDAGIAALIIPLSWVLPMAMAEQVAVVLWPTLILVVTLLVIGYGTRRIFGDVAACFALACTVFWPLTADLHARPGNVDHHNVQFLTMVIVLFAIVWPGRAARAGIIGGAAAAFSLAVGLENIIFVVLAGAVLLARAAYLRGDDVGRLRAFSVSLLVFGVLFWAGQAATIYRFAMICDQLGVPVLAMIGVACAASVLPFAVLRGDAKPLLIIGVAAAVTLAGLVLFWPMTRVCLAGPYGTLPDYIQEFIGGAITEARPGLVYIQLRPEAAVLFLLPVVSAVVIGFGVYLADRRLGYLGDRARTTLLIYLWFCVAGVGLVAYQMRMVNLAATPVPMVAGAVMAFVLRGYLAERSPAAAAKLFLAGYLLVAPILPGYLAAALFDSNASDQGVASCKAVEPMQALNAVPPAVILAHGNLGPLLIWGTHHAALAAPYHRSEAALANAILPFRADDADIEEAIRATGAEMLLLCKDQELQSGFLNQLAQGGSAPWLAQVPVDSEAIALFRILPQ
ncbi:hypothetical protein [Yoonia sp.]|uniref:hypothetical protein n=1 Tax=Yoonia sp. TaxID=2212373 RepID=UPI002FDB8E96